MITAFFGPWANAIAPEEQATRFRELAALALLILGRSHPLVAQLQNAATDPCAAVEAWQMLQALPPRPQRRLLCSYAWLLEAPK